MGVTVWNKSENPFEPDLYPYCHDGWEYARAVIALEIPNSVYIRGACKRFMSDLQKREYPFDVDRAERYLRLVQRFDHIKGAWSTEHIHYEPWQNWVFMNLEGFINPRTGFRRFRVAHIEVPRGSGKSLLASQALLFNLAFDNPKGNEISCAATKSDQARIVLDSARAMANKSPSFLKATGVKVLAHKITHPSSNSFARALSSDSKSLDGLNDSLCIIDELHAVSKELFEVISSGMSKRTDSLLLCITTAGFDIDSIGYSQSSYAKKVAVGDLEDDTFLSIIYTIDEADEDNLFSVDVWKKANPGYGVSVDPITFEAKAKKAQEVPADLNNFKVKHLNMWLNQATAFYDLNKWDECADPTLKIEDFIGQQVMMGLDLASHIDLASKGLVFKKDGIYYIFDKTYVPAETVKTSKSVLYVNCIASGHLIETPGETINFNKFQDEVKEDAKNFRVKECAYDDWNAKQMAQGLSTTMEMVNFNMNAKNFSEPTKKLDVLMREKKIRHNGSPLLRWCLGNVVAKEDKNSNVYPYKENEKLKIDPVIAILMALALHLQSEEMESVYSERGVLSV